MRTHIEYDDFGEYIESLEDLGITEGCGETREPELPEFIRNAAGRIIISRRFFPIRSRRNMRSEKTWECILAGRA